MPEMSTSKITQREAPVEAHKHPRGVRDEITGFDDLGRRIIQQVQDRVPTYVFNCKACQAEDRARMEAPPTLKPRDYEVTLFLVPESEYDNSVCRAYLAKRYPELEQSQASIVSAFHAEKLTYVKGAQMIVVTRRPKSLRGPGLRRIKDDENKWIDVPVPPETYIDDVIESAPLVIDECLDVKPATMFSEQSVDMTELVARLAERAFPYRIAPPADPKDKMYVMRLNA